MDAKKFLENVKQTLNIGLVFGDSREIGRKTIIPVAHFSYGMGHGEGKAQPGFNVERTNASSLSEEKIGFNHESSLDQGKDTSKTSTGQGFGGGFKAKPLGIFQISDDKTIFIPVVSAKQIILIAFALYWMLKRKKRKKKR